jgi:hypothetical protein
VFPYGRLQSITQLGPEIDIEVSLPFGVPNPRAYISEAIVDSGAAITCIPHRCLIPHGSLIFREGRQIEDPGKYRSPAASPLTVKFFAVGD